MTKEDIEKYYQTPEGLAVKKFIEKERQEAVVYSVTNRGDKRIVCCHSPVWQDIEIILVSPRAEEVQRGDILLVSKSGDHYCIVNNNTAEQIKQNGRKKILKDFGESQQQMITLITYFNKNIAK